jgi:hypothetical protein
VDEVAHTSGVLCDEEHVALRRLVDAALPVAVGPDLPALDLHQIGTNPLFVHDFVDLQRRCDPVPRPPARPATFTHLTFGFSAFRFRVRVMRWFLARTASRTEENI